MYPSLTFAAAALAAAVTLAAPIQQDDPTADNHRHPHAAERLKERAQAKALKARSAEPAAAPRSADLPAPALQASPSAAGSNTSPPHMGAGRWRIRK